MAVLTTFIEPHRAFRNNFPMRGEMKSLLNPILCKLSVKEFGTYPVAPIAIGIISNE